MKNGMGLYACCGCVSEASGLCAGSCGLDHCHRRSSAGDQVCDTGAGAVAICPNTGRLQKGGMLI